jgi:hypothetical protein
MYSPGASSDAYIDRYGATSPSKLANFFDNPLVFLSIALVITILVTRAYSSQKSHSETIEPNGTRTVPAAPYWLPLIGHIPNMAYDADNFVRSMRSRFTDGIFTLNFLGSRHNIMYTPGLAAALLAQKQSVANSEEVSRKMIHSIFGFPKGELGKYDAALADTMACYKHLLSEPSLGEMTKQTANRIKGNIKDLVTGNESLVDQAPWERSSDIHVTENKAGERVVEANILTLIRDYAAVTTSITLLGSDYIANFPDIIDDVWTMDKGFMLLAAGLPRWLPIPVLTRAHIARKHILEKTDQFHIAMEKHSKGEDPGSKWSSLDDVGSLVKARMDVYHKFDFSIRARASFENSLMWASNANSDMLIFWMINRIYADKALLEEIREEIAPYVRSAKSQSDLPIAEAPRLDTLDVDGLCNNCPLLKSCYVECLRIDSANWSFKVIKQDFVLQSRDKDAHGWQLRKGDYAHVAHDLHSTDPKYWDDAMVWRADRHIKYDSDEKRKVADLGSIRPYGEADPLHLHVVSADTFCRRRLQYVQRPFLCTQAGHDVYSRHCCDVGH